MLNNFLGKQISCISRCCNLACLCFAHENDEINLHIQCFFRLLHNNKVILSSEDMGYCHENIDDQDFDWSTPGKSIYDIDLKNNKDFICSTPVKSAEQNETGDLLIEFENGLKLEVFIDSTREWEKYRIFDDDYCVEVPADI